MGSTALSASMELPWAVDKLRTSRGDVGSETFCCVVSDLSSVSNKIFDVVTGGLFMPISGYSAAMLSQYSGVPGVGQYTIFISGGIPSFPFGCPSWLMVSGTSSSASAGNSGRSRNLDSSRGGAKVK